MLTRVPFHSTQARDRVREIIQVCKSYSEGAGPTRIFICPVDTRFSVEECRRTKRVPLLLHRIAAVWSLGGVAARENILRTATKKAAEPVYLSVNEDEWRLRQHIVGDNDIRTRERLTCTYGQLPIRFDWMPDEPLNAHDYSGNPAPFVASGSRVLRPRLHPCDVLTQTGNPPYGCRPHILEPAEKKLNELLFGNFVDAREEFPDAWVWAKTVDDDAKTPWSESFKWGREWWGLFLVTFYLPSLHAIVVLYANQTD